MALVWWTMLGWWYRQPAWFIGKRPEMYCDETRWVPLFLRWLANFPEGHEANVWARYDVYGWGMTEERWQDSTYRIDSRTWTGRR